MVTYVRFVFLREYLRARLAPAASPLELEFALAFHRLSFRMATMTEVASIVRADPFLAAEPAMMTFLDNVAATPPMWPPTRDLMAFGSLRVTPTVAFYGFLWRLLLPG